MEEIMAENKHEKTNVKLIMDMDRETLDKLERIKKLEFVRHRAPIIRKAVHRYCDEVIRNEERRNQD
jgi:hypothetical protein